VLADAPAGLELWRDGAWLANSSAGECRFRGLPRGQYSLKAGGKVWVVAVNGDAAMDLAGKAATSGGMKKILGVILILAEVFRVRISEVDKMIQNRFEEVRSQVKKPAAMRTGYGRRSFGWKGEPIYRYGRLDRTIDKIANTFHASASCFSHRARFLLFRRDPSVWARLSA